MRRFKKKILCSELQATEIQYFVPDVPNRIKKIIVSGFDFDDFVNLKNKFQIPYSSRSRMISSSTNLLRHLFSNFGIFQTKKSFLDFKGHSYYPNTLLMSAQWRNIFKLWNIDFIYFRFVQTWAVDKSAYVDRNIIDPCLNNPCSARKV